MRIFILILISNGLLFGACGKKIDCSKLINKTKEQNIQILKEAYENLNNEMDRMFELEEKYKKALEKQNQLLTQLESLEKVSLENEKELSFLMSQNSSILNKIIDIDLTEKNLELEIKK